MIGTFWNLCRACPSMPVDKLHSEYRSTYRWHEYTGPRQDVVRKPPQPICGNREEDENKYADNTTVPASGTGELEPLVAGLDNTDYVGEEKIQEECFSKEEKINIRFKPKREPDAQIIDELQPAAESWFAEVLELRKKAGEYKHRGWGRELVPEHIAELYNKQMTLWEQVSRRSSLSALSLASSTHRSISKEEKEKENNKKTSPTKSAWQQHQVKAASQKIDKVEELKKEPPPRSRMDNFVRHHLERTTGVGEEGILHSPTREKLEPVIPRRKDAVNEINKSPQKTQHIGRSQSAGPNTGAQENRSPKRAARMVQAKSGEKRARPTTLDSAPPRTKSQTGCVKVVPTNDSSHTTGPISIQPTMTAHYNREKSEETEPEVSECERIEPVVKSPPEPTRVKSPEQILMRSPEPVNWTVPLDTGKTFTVTQNVVQGDVHCRAQSESKMRSESRMAPPAPPQSAPPQLHDTQGIETSRLETSTCLDEPSFSFDAAPTQEQKPPNSSDIMEKAHNRFDQFWGTSGQDSQDKTENV